MIKALRDNTCKGEREAGVRQKEKLNCVEVTATTLVNLVESFEDEWTLDLIRIQQDS